MKGAAWSFVAYAATEVTRVVEEAGGRPIPRFKPVAATTLVRVKGATNVTRLRWLDAANAARQHPLVNGRVRRDEREGFLSDPPGAPDVDPGACHRGAGSLLPT